MKGGYQILDLSSFDTNYTRMEIKGVYNNIKGNNGKPVMIITPDGQRVFSQVTEDNGSYLLTYISGEGKTVKVQILDEDIVSLISTDETARIDTLSRKVDDITNTSGTGTLDVLGKRVNAIALGTSVDLSDYNSSSNAYTTPSDGIALVKVYGVAGNDAGLGLTDGTNSFILIRAIGNAGSDQYFTVPVKKGMKLFVTHNSGSSNAFSFIPLS